MKDLQRKGSSGEIHLEFRRRAAGSCGVGASTKLPSTPLPDSIRDPFLIHLHVLAVLRHYLIAFLVMKKVAPWTIRAVAFNPILLTALSLVLVMLPNISHLLISMCKLTKVSIQAFALLLEIPADFCFKSGVWKNVCVWVRRVS